MKTTVSLAIVFLFFGSVIPASELFDRGESLFLANNPQEALPVLQAALRQEPENLKLYEYLGIVYEQLGRHEEAIRTLQQGAERAISGKERFFFNIGNNLIKQEQYRLAGEMYGRAIDTNPAYPPAYLNRARVHITEKRYTDAISDYTVFLSLRSDSPQRENIEKQIAIMRGILDQERIAKENDERRQREAAEEAERRRLEAEARQKALLADVLNSLKNASEDTTNLSAGSEGIQTYDDAISIED